jgi:AcrR family transcriptional regulator
VLAYFCRIPNIDWPASQSIKVITIMKLRIVDAAVELLMSDGLANWTVERVTKRAGCAKGLVHYHYRSKVELLAHAAERIGRRRHDRRVGALARGGAASLDRLWDDLSEEVRSGEFAAWLALLSVPDSRVRESALADRGQVQALGRAAIEALGVEGAPAEVGCLLETLTWGSQIALVRGDDHSLVREAYHRFWLGIVA